MNTCFLSLLFVANGGTTLYAHVEIIGGAVDSVTRKVCIHSENKKKTVMGICNFLKEA